jgi:hypothetical protein
MWRPHVCCNSPMMSPIWISWRSGPAGPCGGVSPEWNKEGDEVVDTIDPLPSLCHESVGWWCVARLASLLWPYGCYGALDRLPLSPNPPKFLSSKLTRCGLGHGTVVIYGCGSGENQGGPPLQDIHFTPTPVGMPTTANQQPRLPRYLHMWGISRRCSK